MLLFKNKQTNPQTPLKLIPLFSLLPGVTSCLVTKATFSPLVLWIQVTYFQSKTRKAVCNRFSHLHFGLAIIKRMEEMLCTSSFIMVFLRPQQRSHNYKKKENNRFFGEAGANDSLLPSVTQALGSDNVIFARIVLP